MYKSGLKLGVDQSWSAQRSFASEYFDQKKLIPLCQSSAAVPLWTDGIFTAA